MTSVLVVGTGDTKGPELVYIRDVIRAAGVEARFVDVGTTGVLVGGAVIDNGVAEAGSDVTVGKTSVAVGATGVGSVVPVGITNSVIELGG
mgnify:CR=1 FL=1